MNISELINKYKNSSIAVVGSAPTIGKFKDKINYDNDIVISCNGSIMCLDKEKNTVDYFLYVSNESPDRLWFNESENFISSIGSKPKRIVPSFLAFEDKNIFENQSVRKSELEKQISYINSDKFLPKETFDLNYDKLNTLVVDGYYYKLEKLKENSKISRNQDSLFLGATVTGIGTQLAYLMGASNINLYGCQFYNPQNSNNYCYDNKGEFGEIVDEHKNNMDLLLDKLNKNGDVKLTSFGETKLKNIDIIK